MKSSQHNDDDEKLLSKKRFEQKDFRKLIEKLIKAADENSWFFDVVQLSINDVTYNIDADAVINMLK